MEEAERFTLPTGAEVEAVGRGPPDLALISRRIKETVRLLEGFKVVSASLPLHRLPSLPLQYRLSLWL